MSQHDEQLHAGHAHAAHGAGGEGYEADMTGATPGVVAAYIVVLSAVFFATLGGLYMYFRYEVDQELQRKVYSVESPELKALRAKEEAALKGKIDAAMKKIATEGAAR